ncbi:hypothetical protein GQ43DRAFT_466026 [Delitschia confertaspora ATCC 74209]|uniref:Uncharacterized protein n=1 Tax=Delitschia confertaspora ATCC 74209 TaxID=1513339 RepID=A0A9P4JF06_9PLEO|nr:hypothetical protein GQ43DRAFT_466026 [Delitschia confertaspora ATCC 74209]
MVLLRELKRKRAAVSYKEASSDTDSAADSAHSDAEEYPPETHQARPQRRSARHAAHEQVEATNEHQASVSRTSRSKRRRKRMVSYRELSDNDGSDVNHVDKYEEDASPSMPQLKTKACPQVKAQKKVSRRRSQPKRALGAPLKHKTTPKPATLAPKILSDGKIPKWSTLPYQVLLDIFVYASYPLHDDNFFPTPDISWLAQMARMCSTFTAPALAALYRNPPIFALKAKRKALVHHLISPVAAPLVNYTVLPKRLELDATKMSHLTDPTHSASDLISLISSLKTLKDIDIFDSYDRPPYRPRSKSIRRWYYPSDLIDALRQSGVRLKSWRWHSAFLSHDFLWMKEVHTANAFRNLRHIIFTKFSFTHSHANELSDGENGGDKVPTSEELLASALAVLPDLEALTFVSSTMANSHLLPLLPENLVSLKFINCDELTSDILQAFLVTHGKHLEELELNHNRSLDLSFLVDLKSSCPRLEVLRMDLNFFSSLALSRDSDPNYEELLREGEIPSWPSRLRIVDMKNLRRWTPVAAKAFFSSLIDSAESLPHLRELTILAMVDINWRERATFRSEWTAKFHTVFLSKAAPPNPHLASFRAFREWKASGQFVEEKHDSFIDADDKEQPEEDDSDVPLILRRPQCVTGKSKSNEKWNTQRLRTRARPLSSRGETPDEYVDTLAIDSENLFIQGQCEKVAFRVDNFRPREDIFDERDFLDSEPSGDEDWNGDDEVVDGYAW